MVALVVSILFSIVMSLGILWYRNRLDDGYKMTWGEATLFSAYIFFLLFIVFGIVPHQWLTLAENEWSFRADRLFDFGGLATAQSQGGWFPFDITLRAVSDSIAAIIYIVYLGGLSKLWGLWQTPKSSGSTEVETSTYGRPLVRRG